MVNSKFTSRTKKSMKPEEEKIQIIPFSYILLKKISPMLLNYFKIKQIKLMLLIHLVIVLFLLQKYMDRKKLKIYWWLKELNLIKKKMKHQFTKWLKKMKLNYLNTLWKKSKTIIKNILNINQIKMIH